MILIPFINTWINTLKTLFKLYKMNSEKQYIQAFNNGYILAENEPHLVSIISENFNSKNDYLNGLIAGCEQYQFDIDKEQLYEIGKLRNHTKINSKEIDRE